MVLVFAVQRAKKTVLVVTVIESLTFTFRGPKKVIAISPSPVLCPCVCVTDVARVEDVNDDPPPPPADQRHPHCHRQLQPRHRRIEGIAAEEALLLGVAAQLQPHHRRL